MSKGIDFKEFKFEGYPPINLMFGGMAIVYNGFVIDSDQECTQDQMSDIALWAYDEARRINGDSLEEPTKFCT